MGTPSTQLVKKRYNRIAPFFDCMEYFMEKRSSGWRKMIWSQISEGQVLEIGIGTGKNMAYYPKGLKVCGIDLSDRMLAQAAHRAKQNQIDIDLIEMDVEALCFKDASFDVIVGTFVFCSIPDPIKALGELSRVIKPGGKIFLLEHVRLDHPFWGRLMDILNPIVNVLIGANINRQTVKTIEKVGLHIESIENMVENGLIKFMIIKAPPSN